MKRISSLLIICLMLCACGKQTESIQRLEQIPTLSEERTTHETVCESSSDNIDNTDDIDNSNTDNSIVDVVIQDTVLDVWDMGLEWYGISYLDTTRTLKLITYEGYGYSPLSYYVACCCWSRATENYWGYSNLYQAFGEADTSYDLWMDDLDIADWAYDALDECYRNPTYCMYCNGMAEPWDYIYYESGIYVWNE